MACPQPISPLVAQYKARSCSQLFFQPCWQKTPAEAEKQATDVFEQTQAFHTRILLDISIGSHVARAILWDTYGSCC